MHAAIIRKLGEPDVFEVGEVVDPVAGPGQILVRQEASSVNPVDWKIRRFGPPIGPELPAILGCDISGRVEAVGDGVTGFAPGDLVYGCGAGFRGMGGAYGELVATDALLLAHRPHSLGGREAAALPLVTITAWEGLHDRARLEAGQSVLVIGGTGGVGHVAVQLAKAAGAFVATTVASPEKAEIAAGLGADRVVDRRGKDMAAILAEAGRPGGFDIVFDTVGDAQLATALTGARRYGTVVSITTRAAVDLTTAHDRSLTLHVIFMPLPMLTGEGRARHGEIMREAAALVDAGKLRPLLDPARFTLHDLPAAHRRLEAGEALGKIVIEIGEGEG